MRPILLALLAVLVAIPSAQAKAGRGHHRSFAAQVLTKDERVQLKAAIKAAREDASVAPLIAEAHKARAALHEAREAKKSKEEIQELRKAYHKARVAAHKALHAALAKNPAAAGLLEKVKAARKARHEKHEKRESGK